LLTAPDDWAALRVRALELLPRLSIAEHHQLLSALGAVVSAPHNEAEYTHAHETALELLPAVQEQWDERGEPLPKLALEIFYELSVAVHPLRAGPQLGVTVSAALEEFQKPWSPWLAARHTTSLELIALITCNEPRALRQIGWPEAFTERVLILRAHLEEVLDRGRTTLETDEDADEYWEPEYEEVVSASYDVHQGLELAKALLGARVASGHASTTLQGLEEVRTRLNRWIEQADEAAEERAVAEREEEGDEEDDEDDRDHAAFSIEAVLADL